jgi:hypothetical protein
MFKDDCLVFLDLLLYLASLLPMILSLPLDLRPGVLYFVTFIGKSLVCLFVSLDLDFHFLICRHLLGSLASQLSQFSVPLASHVIQSQVFVLEPCIVSLGALYLEA